MTRADDLVDLFAAAPAGPGQPITYRQGTVLEWNPRTAENTVRVGSTDLVNLPILNTGEAALLTAGATVGIMVAGSTMAILGRLTIPGTPEAVTALEIVSNNVYTAVNADYGERSTTAWDDPTGTAGPTVSDVYIGRSGKAIVMVSATIATGGLPYLGGGMSYVITGATTRAAPAAGTDLTLQADTDGGFGFGATRVFVEEGLNQGLHTFTAKYRSAVADIVAFQDRVLVVIAL